MTQAHKTMGALVELHPNCFKPPVSPHYDYLKGVIFTVEGAGPPGHTYVRPVGDTTIGTIMLHSENLITVKRKNKQK